MQGCSSSSSLMLYHPSPSLGSFAHRGRPAVLGALNALGRKRAAHESKLGIHHRLSNRFLHAAHLGRDAKQASTPPLSLGWHRQGTAAPGSTLAPPQQNLLSPRGGLSLHSDFFSARFLFVLFICWLCCRVGEKEGPASEASPQHKLWGRGTVLTLALQRWQPLSGRDICEFWVFG